MYYNARYYDPLVGRFISADTIVPNPTDPQQLNRYTYVTNNPVLYRDPTGHCQTIGADDVCRIYGNGWDYFSDWDGGAQPHGLWSGETEAEKQARRDRAAQASLEDAVEDANKDLASTFDEYSQHAIAAGLGSVSGLGSGVVVKVVYLDDAFNLAHAPGMAGARVSTAS